MKPHLLVGLDVGTTHVKAAAYTPDGVERAAARRAYPTHYPTASWAEQTPQDWLRASLDCLGEVTAILRAAGERVAGLGLSAHAPTLVPADALGASLLERVPIWQDERSVIQARQLLHEVGPDWVGLGMPYASFAAKLKWFVETHPDRARRAVVALGAKGYVANWLTGCCATDPSSEPGDSPGNQATAAACGWSVDRLAPVLPATAVVGELRDDLSQQLDLPRRLPVVIGVNDGASSVLGNGAVDVGEGIITLSTNGVVFLVTESPMAPEERLRRAVFCWPYLGGRWIVGGQMKAGAVSLQWLLGVLQESPAGDDAIERLLEACEGVPPGSRGVLFFPYLMGLGTPHDNPAVRGAFTGLTMATGRPELARAVLEGVAFTLRDILEEVSRLVPRVGRLNLTGGGARSRLWRQIVTDVLDRPLGYSEADACLGAAMLAGVGLGLFADVRTAARRMVRPPLMIMPRPAGAEAYRQSYDEFRRQRDAQLSLYEA